MREKFNLPPLHITADKRQNSFYQNCLRQLLLSTKRYAIVSKEKRKVLEKIVRSDKRIKSIQIIALINQKGRGEEKLLQNINFLKE